MVDIFVSYTSSDRDWAFWIGQELEKLGHSAHVHEWEISAGGDVAQWMSDRLQTAERRRSTCDGRHPGRDFHDGFTEE